MAFGLVLTIVGVNFGLMTLVCLGGSGGSIYLMIKHPSDQGWSDIKVSRIFLDADVEFGKDSNGSVNVFLEESVRSYYDSLYAYCVVSGKARPFEFRPNEYVSDIHCNYQYDKEDDCTRLWISWSNISFSARGWMGVSFTWDPLERSDYAHARLRLGIGSHNLNIDELWVRAKGIGDTLLDISSGFPTPTNISYGYTVWTFESIANLESRLVLIDVFSRQRESEEKLYILLSGFLTGVGISVITGAGIELLQSFFPKGPRKKHSDNNSIIIHHAFGKICHSLNKSVNVR